MTDDFLDAWAFSIELDLWGHERLWFCTMCGAQLWTPAISDEPVCPSCGEWSMALTGEGRGPS